MKIDADQIEKKSIAGQTKDGRNVVYIKTLGGLHIFFCKNQEGKIESIGAAPHRAIAKYLSSKKEDIAWKDDFHKSEDLAKSEIEQFERLRNLVFFPASKDAVGPSDILLVYDTATSKIDIIKSEDFIRTDYDEYCLVRDCSLQHPAQMLKHYEVASE